MVSHDEANHHLGEYVWNFFQASFPKQIQTSGFGNHKKFDFFHRGLNSTGKLHIQRFDTRTLTWKPKIGGLGPCFSILPSGKFSASRGSSESSTKTRGFFGFGEARRQRRQFRRNADRCGSLVRWFVANNLEEWLVMGVTTHV